MNYLLVKTPKKKFGTWVIALVLLEWDLVSGAPVVSVVVFAVNVVPVHCVVLVVVPVPVDVAFSD
jgi:hypothetical protein